MEEDGENLGIRLKKKSQHRIDIKMKRKFNKLE